MNSPQLKRLASYSFYSHRHLGLLFWYYHSCVAVDVILHTQIVGALHVRFQPDWSQHQVELTGSERLKEKGAVLAPFHGAVILVYRAGLVGFVRIVSLKGLKGIEVLCRYRFRSQLDAESGIRLFFLFDDLLCLGCHLRP